MTPNQLTALIAENLDKEFDIPFRLQLWERVKYWRDKIIDQAISKRPQDRKFYVQSLFLSMSTVNSIPCNALINLPVSATEEEIPQLVLAGGIIFDYFGGVDGKSPYREVRPGMYNYVSESIFQKMFPAYEYSNNRGVVDKIDVPMVRIDAIFHDPQYVNLLTNSCTGNTSDPWDQEFPMPGDITQQVVQMILQVDYNRKPEERAPEIQV